MPSRHPRARAALAAAAVIVVALRFAPGADPAAAAVEHGDGYDATVLGWTSWYGSYTLAGLGTGWCIDHGLRAPDAALGYAPTDAADHSAERRAAVAWIAGEHGAAAGGDPVLAAAVMLAVHDLMGAAYPYGALDVDVMSVDDLAGFGGDEEAVLGTARRLKADGLAHAHLRGPLSVRLDAPAVVVGHTGKVAATVVDAAGQPVEGAQLRLIAHGTAFSDGRTDTGWHRTPADGALRIEFGAASEAASFEAFVEVADPQLSAFASTGRPAQRVVMPARVQLHGSIPFAATIPPSHIVIRKVDRRTGIPLAGAEFDPAHDSDGDGSFETPWPTIVTGPDGRAAFDGPSGRWQFVERLAPPGYRLIREPVTAEAEPGGPVEVVIENVPLPPPPTTTTTTTTTATTAPEPTTTTSPPPPPASVEAPPPTAVPAAAPALPRTGRRLAALATLGAGALLVGASLRSARRPSPAPGR